MCPSAPTYTIERIAWILCVSISCSITTHLSTLHVSVVAVVLHAATAWIQANFKLNLAAAAAKVLPGKIGTCLTLGSRTTLKSDSVENVHSANFTRLFDRSRLENVFSTESLFSLFFYNRFHFQIFELMQCYTHFQLNRFRGPCKNLESGNVDDCGCQTYQSYFCCFGGSSTDVPRF